MYNYKKEKYRNLINKTMIYSNTQKYRFSKLFASNALSNKHYSFLVETEGDAFDVFMLDSRYYEEKKLLE